MAGGRVAMPTWLLLLVAVQFVTIVVLLMWHKPGPSLDHYQGVERTESELLPMPRDLSPPNMGKYVLMEDAALPGMVIRDATKRASSLELKAIMSRLAEEVRLLEDNLWEQVPRLSRRQRQRTVDALLDQAGRLKRSARMSVSSTIQNTTSLDGNYDLIIGILSARDNFDKRQAVRDTWMKVARQHKDSVLVRFVIGDTSCPVHPDDRTDIYTCQDKGPFNPVLERPLHLFDALEGATQHASFSGPVGVDFETRTWVTISHIGVLQDLATSSTSGLQVKLYDRANRKVMTQKSFYSRPPSKEVIGGFHYQTVSSITVGPNFKGTLVVEGLKAEQKVPVASERLPVLDVNEGGGVISVSSGIRQGLMPDVFPESVDSSHDQVALASIVFTALPRAPAMVYSLPWQEGVTYTDVSLSTQDVLKLNLKGNYGVVQVPDYQAWLSCSATNVQRDWIKSPLRPLADSSDSALDAVEIGDLEPGEYYVLEPTHCVSGMKIKLIVTPVKDIRDDIASMAHSRVSRAQTWKDEVAKTTEFLQLEQKLHHDLLVVPSHVDSYRNLATKLLYFYQWASLHRFKFTLKTDDDTLVDVASILKNIKASQIPSNRAWWGNFRKDWPVERTGKWGESEFHGSHYPPFACGSGNLLTPDLVAFLSDNSNHLHAFQGEDVSVGIWIAPTAPVLVQDSRFSCFGPEVTCQDNAVVLPQLQPDEMRRRFHWLFSCQSLCGCSS